MDPLHFDTFIDCISNTHAEDAGWLREFGPDTFEVTEEYRGADAQRRFREEQRTRYDESCREV